MSAIIAHRVPLPTGQRSQLPRDAAATLRRVSDPVVVLGAGMAGLSAARDLRQAGYDVVVVDKGRSVGGRLATRRIGAATLDHGAQFFTVRERSLADLVAGSDAAGGPIVEWCRGFGPGGDGYPRYAATGGMNALAKWLAVGLDCRVGVRIDSMAAAHGSWLIHHADGHLTARAVVATPPIPQTLALLEAGGTTLPEGLAADLAAVRWYPTLAALVVLDSPSAVPEPGGVQLDGATQFAFVADNHQKGISEIPALTLHATHEVSGYRWDDPPAAVLDDLVRWARPWLGGAAVVDAQLKRWRYAGPVEPWPDPTLVVEVDGAPLALAGDAFAGPKVEGAHTSGRAAAAALVELLG